MSFKTALYQNHLKHDAKIVDFNGWLMPIHYGSQLEEHHAVRDAVGIFDVSHMMVTDIAGAESTQFLQYLLANDISKLEQVGQALYSLMLNEQGGVIDDLIVYRRTDGFRIVSNAGTRNKVTQWLIQQSESFDVVCSVKNEQAMIAIQGPDWYSHFSQLLDDEACNRLQQLKKFSGMSWNQWFIAKTGYTGEAGVEVMLPAAEAGAIWDRLVEIGAQPCGLGARDTLRLEAGLNLYGSDMDDSTLPSAANLSWTVAMDEQTPRNLKTPRNFIGKQALMTQSANETMIGLVISGRVIPRSGQKVTRGAADNSASVDGSLADGSLNDSSLSGGSLSGGSLNDSGVITSGSFSPTLGMGIAFARVPKPVQSTYQVQIRNKSVESTRVSLPFVRNGKKAFAVKS